MNMDHMSLYIASWKDMVEWIPKDIRELIKKVYISLLPVMF
jgi:hypothetical protein